MRLRSWQPLPSAPPPRNTWTRTRLAGSKKRPALSGVRHLQPMLTPCLAIARWQRSARAQWSVCLSRSGCARPKPLPRLRGRIEAVLDYARARGWRKGRQPHPVARQHEARVAERFEGQADQPPPRAALAADWRLHGGTPTQAGNASQGAGFRNPDGGPLRRSAWGPAGAKSIWTRRSGRSGRADEGRQGAPGAAVQAGTGDPGRPPRAQYRRCKSCVAANRAHQASVGHRAVDARAPHERGRVGRAGGMAWAWACAGSAAATRRSFAPV